MLITREQYIAYLICIPINYTGSNLADHLEQVSQVAVNDFVKHQQTTAHELYQLVSGLLKDSQDAYLILDDSVQDKRYSKKIKMTKHQYSANEHGLVRGIGVVNLFHSDGLEFYPIDFRIYAPTSDGKTRNEHFREMLGAAFETKQLTAQTILFDSWYASVDNLKLINCHQRYFVTTLKANRMVSTNLQTGYRHLEAIE